MEGEGTSKKKKQWIKILAAILILAAIGAGYAAYRYQKAHQYDEFLVNPEAAAGRCIRAVNEDEKEYPLEASLYSYMKYRRNKSTEEPPELRQMYILNKMKEDMGSIDGYKKRVEDVLWSLRYYTFSEPEKIIQEKENEVWFKSQGTYIEEHRAEMNNLTSELIKEYQYDDLWLRFNRASNGNWYLSNFTSAPPFDWAGNEPMTEKNREIGPSFAEQLSEEEIYHMFYMASAAQLNSDGWQRGFGAPYELGWENFLNFFFASLDESEKAEAYDEEGDCYRFSEEQIGRRVWQYLGEDENDKDATKYGGFPHGGQLLYEYKSEEEPELFEFERKQIEETKTFDTDGMKLIKKEVLDSGMVLLEIAYQEKTDEESQDTIEPVKNRQILKVRPMEQGYRLLSYEIIEPGRESEANRIPGEFIWKNWTQVVASRYSYEEGEEEPTSDSRRLTGDYQDIREYLGNLTFGKMVDSGKLPETAKLIGSLGIEAKSGDLSRVYGVNQFEAEGKNYMVLESMDTELAIGSAGSGISVSLNGVPLTQVMKNRRELVCEFEDGALFLDMLKDMMEQ